jgi:hypothetical protein
MVSKGVAVNRRGKSQNSYNEDVIWSFNRKWLWNNKLKSVLGTSPGIL